MTRVLDTKSLIWCVGCQAGQAPDSIITWENLKSGLRFVTRPWGTRLMTAFLGILTALSPVLGSDGGPSTAQPQTRNQIRDFIFWPEPSTWDQKVLKIWVRGWSLLLMVFFSSSFLTTEGGTCEMWGALGDNLDSNMTSTDHRSVLREAHPKTHKFSLSRK